ncbi:hypothetical protein KEM52_004030, partial [Ascosphaera acerosa]
QHRLRAAPRRLRRRHLRLHRPCRARPGCCCRRDSHPHRRHDRLRLRQALQARRRQCCWRRRRRRPARRHRAGRRAGLPRAEPRHAALRPRAAEDYWRRRYKQLGVPDAQERARRAAAAGHALCIRVRHQGRAAGAALPAPRRPVGRARLRAAQGRAPGPAAHPRRRVREPRGAGRRAARRALRAGRAASLPRACRVGAAQSEPDAGAHAGAGPGAIADADADAPRRPRLHASRPTRRGLAAAGAAPQSRRRAAVPRAVVLASRSAQPAQRKLHTHAPALPGRARVRGRVSRATPV